YAVTRNSNGYADRLYNGIACATGCNVTSGTPISTAVGIAPSANFQLPVNTPSGVGVFVQPREPASGAFPVGITFTTVAVGGRTTLSLPSTGAALPEGFRLGTPPFYLDLATTASVAPLGSVCVNFVAGSFVDTSRVKLLHREGAAWVDVTSS